jgi:hypothetical protein
MQLAQGINITNMIFIFIMLLLLSPRMLRRVLDFLRVLIFVILLFTELVSISLPKYNISSIGSIVRDKTSQLLSSLFETFKERKYLNFISEMSFII